jgi:hypothetical protein
VSDARHTPLLRAAAAQTEHNTNRDQRLTPSNSGTLGLGTFPVCRSRLAHFCCLPAVSAICVSLLLRPGPAA